MNLKGIYENFSDEIKYYLKVNEMSQKELAMRLGLSLKHMNSILNDEISELTTSILEGLENAFHLHPGYFSERYMVYRNKLKAAEMGEQIKIIFSEFGLDFLIRHADISLVYGFYIKKEMEDWQKLMELKRFYGVSNLLDYKEYLEKHILADSQKYQSDPNSYVWIRLCELGLDYDGLNIGNFRNSQYHTTIKKVLNIMSSDAKFLDKTTEIKKFLATKGIVLVTKRFLADSKIKSITLKKGAKRFIFLSDKYKRESYIYFSLLHEIIHCYLPNLKESEIDETVISEYENWERNTHSTYKAIYDATTAHKHIKMLRIKNPNADVSYIWETIQDKYEEVTFNEDNKEEKNDNWTDTEKQI
ncbi:helix-turn-helix domain-containing protein [[Mycoplasma] gypis]|uniref:Helix-turn-helix transcriptional regulator n=1 Tax=[Mycoplasma] gypis TaxID=92404 RepID=A0ABZ2RPA6_9BACT|nr:helix-turn-helix transcriptional regulator [[Mycoplasma] gypis]MBN0919056.1 helix-turn-helix transcriptional regulator [[Mycoplasma] gypis]